MKPETAALLRCPACHRDHTLDLDIRSTDAVEVRSGGLNCRSCGHVAEIADGIVDMFHDVPDFVTREEAGLARFAETMRADGWDGDRIRALPEISLGYWQSQAAAMQSMLRAMTPEPRATLVDVGSNTCWASNIFATQGLRVLAVDISTVDLQGLRAAEHFLSQGVFFERLKTVMFDLALASESVDYVFCNEVLHHNDADHLDRTLRELYRVLKPGGSLMVAGEPMRFPMRRKRDHGAEVADYDGNENVYYLHQYYRAARRAGFRVQLRQPPGGVGFRALEHRLGAGRRQRTVAAVNQFVEAHGILYRGVALTRMFVTGDVSLSFLGHKPLDT